MLWVQPNAKKSGFAGLHGERLKLKLSAPPVEGKANAALLQFLSDTLELPTRNLSLVAGQSARAKTVRVSDISDETLLARLSNVS